MRSVSFLLVALFFAVPLVGCGSGSGAPPPGLSPLDAPLRSALTASGVTPVSEPAPDDPALVTLGRMLFFDKILSGNMNISCATCHHPVAATGDALPVSIGEGGSGLAENRQPGSGAFIPRNAPHVFNGGVPGVNSMFWDSRVTHDPVTGVFETPESGLNGGTPVLADHAAPLTSAMSAQAMFPVTSPEEMRGHGNDVSDGADQSGNQGVWAALMARLVGTNGGSTGGIEAYRALFSAAYPGVSDFDAFTFGHAAEAIAAFERAAWTALDTPFDRYLAGDDSALSDSEKAGALLFFGKARCGECHNGPLLTDFEHYALCVPQVGPGKVEPNEDRGLALETGLASDDYKFRTPALRNVALTGPWMHDGAFTSLETAVRHVLNPAVSLIAYDATQLPPLFQGMVDTDPARQAARVAALEPILSASVDLTDDEFAALMDFLHALTDPASLVLLQDVPDSVPSGLPVAD